MGIEVGKGKGRQFDAFLCRLVNLVGFLWPFVTQYASICVGIVSVMVNAFVSACYVDVASGVWPRAAIVAASTRSVHEWVAKCIKHDM